MFPYHFFEGGKIMVNNMRRVRCILCNDLVSRVPPGTVSKDYGSKYSVKTLQVGDRRGCICSFCVEDLYASYNMIVKAKYGFSKRSSIKTIAPMPAVPTSSVSVKKESPSKALSTSLFNPNNQDFMDSLVDSLKKSFPIPVVISHPHENAKKVENSASTEQMFECLNYSLDSYLSIVKSKVFGQDEAAQMLLYTIYFNQFANFLEEYGLAPNIIRRSHILIVGNTGVGKTFLTTTVANIMKIPYAFCNAPSITSAGYIGGKVEEFLEELYRNAGCNLKLAENGILFIDEIDKKRVESNKSGRDVTGRAVQEELLKVMEASSIHLKSYNIDINPKNITVVMMGAFVGLDEIISKRMNKKVIGFKAANEDAQDAEITPDDLIEYGLIPEFIGRVSTIIKMNPISKTTIIDIIYSMLENFNIIFKVKNIELSVSDFFIDSLADTLATSSTGARDVYSKLYNILFPSIYQVFQNKGEGVCQIDASGNTEIIICDQNKKTKYFHFDSKYAFDTDEEF